MFQTGDDDSIQSIKINIIMNMNFKLLVRDILIESDQNQFISISLLHDIEINWFWSDSIDVFLNILFKSELINNPIYHHIVFICFRYESSVTQHGIPACACSVLADTFKSNNNGNNMNAALCWNKIYLISMYWSFFWRVSDIAFAHSSTISSLGMFIMINMLK